MQDPKTIQSSTYNYKNCQTQLNVEVWLYNNWGRPINLVSWHSCGGCGKAVIVLAIHPPTSIRVRRSDAERLATATALIGIGVGELEPTTNHGVAVIQQ